MWSGLDGFPAFYGDEPVFSHCARFTKRQQPVSNAGWLKELFGKTYQYAIVDLPTSLLSYSSRAPTIYGYTSDYLIDNHTAAPFYLFGRREDQIMGMREKMKTNGAANIHVYAGLSNASLLRPPYLRVCKKCLRENDDLKQERHWHVDHQLAGIGVCSRHGIHLTDTQIPSKGLTSFITVEDALKISPFNTPSMPPDPRLIELAEGATYILDHPEMCVTVDRLHELYYAACAEKQFLFGSGRVNVQRAAERVRDYYPSQILRDLNLLLHEQSTKTWAYELLAAPKVVRPTTKHLLVIQALGFSIEEFLALASRQRSVSCSFGKGPWPCLNKASSHFMARKIKMCRIQRINGQLRGEFACECGYTFSLTEPQKGQVSDRNTRTFQGYTLRVLEYGETWDNRLRHMWADETCNLKNIAQRLGVTSDTVKAQAPRLGLAFPPAGSPATKPPSPRRIRKNECLRSKYETLWLKMRHILPDASITELQLLLPKQSIWLRLYDKEWFELNCPSARSPSRGRVDWEALDDVLAEQVRQTASDYHNVPHFERRITTAVLSKGIGLAANFLSARLSKLSKTKVVLEQYIETPEQHALHRLMIIRAQCLEKKVSLTASQIRKRAGLSERMAARPLIRTRIIEIVVEIA